DGFAFAALVDERFTAAERGFGGAQEAEDEAFRFGCVDGAVRLLLRPAGAGDEEEFRVGADGLLARLRGTDACDGSTSGCFDRYVFDRRRGGRAAPRGEATALQQDEPG